MVSAIPHLSWAFQPGCSILVCMSLAYLSPTVTPSFGSSASLESPYIRKTWGVTGVLEIPLEGRFPNHSPLICPGLSPLDVQGDPKWDFSTATLTAHL